MRESYCSIATACLLAAIAAPANGQLTIQPGGGQVNLSGATLFAPFYPTLAATNDVINADSDFVTCSGLPKAGFFDNNCDGFSDSVDQLAASFSCSMSTFWAVNIRGVGSGNGLAEFRDFQLCGTIPSAIPSEGGWFNRTVYAASGNVVNLSCPGQGASGTPFPQNSVDIGVMDVPTPWFVTVPGAPAWNATPAAPGYGLNPNKSLGTSTVPGGQSNALKDLCSPCGSCLNIDFTLDPLPATTVYDTVVAWVPIAIIANRGTGVENLSYSEVQHLWTTGRLPNGMNLKAATRDAGSGTRNGAMNSIGVDPSWGVGDNVGKKN